MKRGYKTSYSEVKSAACEQRWWLQHGLGLEPVREERAPRVGRLWHRLMHAWWWPPDISDLFERAERIEAELRLIEAELIALASVEVLFEEQRQLSRDEAAELVALLRAMLAEYKRADRELEERWRVLGSEMKLSGHPTAPSGHSSPWTAYGGRLDKLMQDQRGQLWVWEHKVQLQSLAGWRERHEYSLQAVSYAWLVEQETGHRPVGVVYDLVLAKVSPRPTDLEVVKRGDRLSKQLPTGTTAATFLAALTLHGWTLESQDWYRETFERLQRDELEGGYVRRERIRFAEGEVERAGRELYHVATRLRRMANRAEAERSAPTADLETLATLVVEQADEWPRNGSECWSWGRRCPWMDVCRYQSVEALRGMRLWRLERDGGT